MPHSAPKTRLASWIRLAVLATVASTTIALFLVVDHFAENYARQQSGDRLQQLAWQMKDALDRGIHERFVDVQLLTSLAASGQAPADLRATLNNLQVSQPYYAWIGLADSSGKVLVATGGLLEGVDVSQRPWFQGAKANVFTGDYHPAVLLEKKLPQANEPWRFIDVAVPIQNNDGSLKGIIGAHLSWGWARDLAHRLLDPAQQHYGVEVLIVRKDGTILLGPKQFEEKKIDTTSFQLSQTGQASSISESWPDGQYITGYAKTNTESSNGMGWSILVRQPSRVAMEDFKHLEHRIIMAGGALALLLAFVAALIARRLAKPLNVLTSAIEKRTGDESDADLPVVGGYREAHLLATTLTNLINTEKVQRHALHRLNNNLESEVAARTTELRAAADQLQQALVEQNAAKEELQRIVLLDTLTGLPNRRAFHEELPRAMARSQRNAHAMAVLFLDLDGFKGINDTYGHEAGDLVLREFAARIRASVRVTDMVARLAGDEFTVILEQLSQASDAVDVAQKLLDSMRSSFALAEANVTLSSSVGVAMFMADKSVTPDQLIHAADQAMYAAKRAGKNRIQLAD
ncbi:MAG TPA: sensor domain-containing diguanylate cyclase [Rhodocyclaceae bacterium]|nr:sensor domain-containing diguanylate cyclase [Rhodocyclaceae bacterium]